MKEQNQNQNQGVLFKNTKKTSEKHPDYLGNLIINDTEYEIVAWENTSKNGTKYLSVKAKIKEPF